MNDLEKSIEGLPKHGFDPLDILSPPAIVGVILLAVAIAVYVVTA